MRNTHKCNLPVAHPLFLFIARTRRYLTTSQSSTSNRKSRMCFKTNKANLLQLFQHVHANCNTMFPNVSYFLCQRSLSYNCKPLLNSELEKNKHAQTLTDYHNPRSVLETCVKI